MRPFSIKKKGKRSINDETRDLTQLITRPEIEHLDNNNTQLRFWLPEECKQAMDEIIECCQATGARYLRELFVAYLYGEHELYRMRAQKCGLYWEPPPEPVSEEERRSCIMYSRSPAVDTVPGLGKNIVPVKLYLPEQMKQDLQTLADRADVKLSTFVREILISNLLGHTLWQERLRSWTPEEERLACQWEKDQTGECRVELYEWEEEDENSREPKVTTYSW